MRGTTSAVGFLYVSVHKSPLVSHSVDDLLQLWLHPVGF